MIEVNITLLKQQCLNIRHNIYTEEINKVALSANDDKESSWKMECTPWLTDITNVLWVFKFT